jgi:hypothetical protein
MLVISYMAGGQVAVSAVPLIITRERKRVCRDTDIGAGCLSLRAAQGAQRPAAHRMQGRTSRFAMRAFRPLAELIYNPPGLSLLPLDPQLLQLAFKLAALPEFDRVTNGLFDAAFVEDVQQALDFITGVTGN